MAHIYQHHKERWVRNPVSGHEWPDHILLNKFTLYGNLGIPMGEYKTYAAASRALKEREAFEAKFPPPFPKGPLRRAPHE